MRCPIYNNKIQQTPMAIVIFARWKFHYIMTVVVILCSPVDGRFLGNELTNVHSLFFTCFRWLLELKYGWLGYCASCSTWNFSRSHLSSIKDSSDSLFKNGLIVLNAHCLCNGFSRIRTTMILFPFLCATFFSVEIVAAY